MASISWIEEAVSSLVPEVAIPENRVRKSVKIIIRREFQESRWFEGMSENGDRKTAVWDFCTVQVAHVHRITGGLEASRHGLSAPIWRPQTIMVIAKGFYPHSTRNPLGCEHRFIEAEVLRKETGV